MSVAPPRPPAQPPTRPPAGPPVWPPVRPPALPAAAPPAGQELPPWRPVAWRTRGWLLLGAAITAVVIAWLMLQPKLRLMAARAERGEAPVPIGLPTEAHRAAQARLQAPGAAPPSPEGTAPERPACGDRPTPGCVGGPMPVLVLPAAPASR